MPSWWRSAISRSSRRLQSSGCSPNAVATSSLCARPTAACPATLSCWSGRCWLPSASCGATSAHASCCTAYRYARSPATASARPPMSIRLKGWRRSADLAAEPHAAGVLRVLDHRPRLLALRPEVVQLGENARGVAAADPVDGHSPGERDVVHARAQLAARAHAVAGAGRVAARVRGELDHGRRLDVHVVMDSHAELRAVRLLRDGQLEHAALGDAGGAA